MQISTRTLCGSESKGCEVCVGKHTTKIEVCLCPDILRWGWLCGQDSEKRSNKMQVAGRTRPESKQSFSFIFQTFPTFYLFSFWLRRACPCFHVVLFALHGTQVSVQCEVSRGRQTNVLSAEQRIGQEVDREKQESLWMRTHTPTWFKVLCL